MRETSPGSVSIRSTASLLGNGCVTKNAGFQSNSSSVDNLVWNSGPSISLPKNTHLNIVSDQQKSPLQRTNSNASVLTSLCGDLSPSDSHFFEVLYIGKVRISQRKVPDSLIDDALQKFAQHEIEKAKTSSMRRHSLLSSTGTSVYSSESTDNIAEQPQSDIKAHVEKKRVSFLQQTSSSPDRNMHKTFSCLDKIEDESNFISEENVNEDIDDEFDVFTKERADKVINKTNSELKLDTEHNLSEVEKIKECFRQIENNLFIDESTFDNAKQETKTNFLKEVDKNQNCLPKVQEHVPLETDSKKISFCEIKRKPIEEKITAGFDDLAKNPLPENKKFLRDRAASIGTLNLKTPLTQIIEQNRTMLFQVGRSELRLISPDRKQILLHRSFKDVASCVVGRLQKEHFGFVCREAAGESYACYVFKCESDEVANEIVTAIKQAFIAHAEAIKKSREKSPNLTCEHCPQLWFQRLTHDLQGMTDKRAHAFILRRIEHLSEEEQDQIINKYQSGTNQMYDVNEHIAFLMRLLKAHCESKQLRHVHDTAENRSEFLNQYLGGSTIFMKAKRSLSSGFDHLLKRRSSKDDGLLAPKKDSYVPSPVDTPSPEPVLLSPDSARSKSLSPFNQNYPDVPPSPNSVAMDNTPAEEIHEEDEEEKHDIPASTSPMMDIFSKVSDSRPPTAASGAADQESTWRQAIYQTVLQPDSHNEGDLLSSNIMNFQEVSFKPGKKTKDDLRQLWQMAINQTILLVRMEKENAKLKEKEESSAVRRIKLEYAELGGCDAGVTLMWDSLLASRKSSHQLSKVDHHMLTQAVIQGVPRQSRGAVWYFLAEQASLRSAPPDPRTAPLYNTPYRTLLAGLTKHQHAILIDLGRTFPQHSYFSSALGPGQLSLYNILKAYSLLDPDVGYCQGLSFVAGVLLLHMEEAEAFVLLRHLMFRRGLRKQYLPDMSALQVQLYQLSRLLRDHEPELHSKLEDLEISPALYAAPWMLTLFTSQFPLGFVVRVFDLIFLESMDVIFSVSLALLSAHKDGLMLCESCEEAAEYLKHKLPDIDKNLYEKVIKKVYTLDVSRQLSEYAVEYGVLREEMPRITMLEDANKKLTLDNNRMSLELDSAMDSITNYQKIQSKLETQSKVMEQQLSLLCRYITSSNRQDMTPEIKKIVQTYSKKRSKILPNFISRDDEDEDKRILKVGMSSPNLFSKITPEDVLNAVNKEKTSPENNRRHFLMKKSQSVHSGLIAKKNYPLKVLEEANENDKNRRTESFRTNNIIMESLKELSKKNTSYFPTTHEQIRQERIFEQQLKHDFDENLKKLDEKLNEQTLEDLDLFQSKKSISLNMENRKSEQRASNDKSEDKKDDASIISHPLSDCDIDIKFDGQSTKLKQIRPLSKNH